jgi:MSHA pilin protein MshC
MRRSAIYRAHPAEDRRGFTLIELVTVITIVGVLAAFVAPRFWSQQTFSDRGYVDELAAALRSTQKAAVISGCPARLTLAASSYVATQQAASGNSCNLSDNTWPTPILSADGSAIQDTAPANTTAAPIGVFQFDTQGGLSSSPSTAITVGTHTLTIIAGTGLVQVQ